MKMLITCSDPRIKADQIVNLPAGEVFVLRNAGNIIPHFNHSNHGAEAAALELAVEVLGVEEIVVCGHSDCGAMKTLMRHPGIDANALPSMRRWVEHAQPAFSFCRPKAETLPIDDQLNAIIRANVELQCSNIESYPCVAKKLATGTLKISSMIYDLASHEISCCDHNDLRRRA